MPRKKKVEEKVEEVVEAPVETGIGHFTDNFGREDLNNLVAKVNEVIDAVNK